MSDGPTHEPVEHIPSLRAIPGLVVLRPADETRTAPPGEVDGPPGADGVRRTRTGWRRARPGGPDEPG